ncbi:IS3 family transposase [Spirochaeta thermophila]|uniref:IS3 family transposase n=1 Tax=Winmispira thermophila TaxID=154 RepID=UPI001FDFD2F4|nr:IS3 family transposase [Spirochaeta thermophila]
MKKRTWTTEEKLAIVLEGLRGERQIAEICREHQISQTMYYRWRDRFLEGGTRALADGRKEKDTYRAKIEQLEKIIAKQAIQIENTKKNEGAVGEIEAVERLVGEGYRVKDACEALGVSRSRYYARRKRGQKVGKKREEKERDDGRLMEKIRDLVGEHPYWGYRRVAWWLRRREGEEVSEKRVRGLMKGAGLMCRREKKKARRGSGRGKPVARRPREWWGIDMTKVLVKGIGWVYLVIVLDWYTKKLVGWKVSVRGRSEEWCVAMEMAVEREFPEGVRGRGLRLVSDNGSQPLSRSFMKAMEVLGIEQVFTSYNNPKGNADTERMIRTMKEELLWLREWEHVGELEEAVRGWAEEYNQHYVHSALGYRSPEEYEALWAQMQGEEVA